MKKKGDLRFDNSFCTDCTETECLECKDGYFKSTLNSSCMLNENKVCKDEEFYEDKECKKCSDIGLSNCKSCSNNPPHCN